MAWWGRAGGRPKRFRDPTGEARLGSLIHERLARPAILGDRPLREPAGVGVDGAGDIYLTDAQSRCVRKLSARGHLLAEWGGEGEALGRFRNPAGLTVDARGALYVADRGNDRIVRLIQTT